MILVNTRLTEVRGFSDFFSEFFTALRKAQFPPNMRMVVLCNRPNYELRAFQVCCQQRPCTCLHMPAHASPPMPAPQLQQEWDPGQHRAGACEEELDHRQAWLPCQNPATKR